MNLPPAERILADVAEYLIQEGETEAARMLLSCSLELHTIKDFVPEGEWKYGVDATVRGPDDTFLVLGGVVYPSHPVRLAIMNALQYRLGDFECKVELTAIPGVNIFDPGWRNELLERAREAESQDSKLHNQGRDDFGGRLVVWNTLRFRSETERRIAAALERVGVMFLPNCRVRLGPPDKRQNREGDFLICHEGKWGILEVDGEPYHPPSRKAQEDERDRLFKLHGVRVVEHFDATRCFEAPTQVVKEFLAILRQS